MTHEVKTSFMAHFQLREPDETETAREVSAGFELPKDFFASTEEGDGFLSFRDTVFAVFCDDEMMRLNDED
jgi:hypothetical protein